MDKKVGLQKVQVFFSGENLLTFTTLKGMFDPEAIFTKNDYTAGRWKELSYEQGDIFWSSC